MKNCRMFLAVFAVLLPLLSFAQETIDSAVKDEVESFWSPDVKTSTRLMLRIRKFVLLEPQESNSVPVPDAEAKKRGFLLFKRSLAERLNYNTNPKKDELNPVLLETAGCPGETLAFTLGIFPLAEGIVNVATSDLKSAYGALTSKDDIEIRNVKYMLKQCSMGMMVQPEITVKESDIKLKPGVTRQLLVLIRVPEGAKPGIYEGALVLKTKNGQSEVKLKTEVLPFKLEENPSMTFGWEMGPKTGADYELFKKLGCNSVGEGLEPSVISVSGGKVKLDFSKADKTAEFLKKYGLDGFEQKIHYADVGNAIAQLARTNELSPEFMDAYKDAVIQMQAWQKAKGIKAAYWIADRVFNAPPYPGNKSMNYCMQVMKVIKGIPGVRVMVNPTNAGDAGANYADLVAALDIAGVYAEKTCAANLAKGLEKGNINLFGAGRSRISWGFLPWKYKAVGRTELNFLSWDEKTSRSPQSVSSSYSSFTAGGICYPEKDGYSTTITAELVRQGIMDNRYLYTLEKMIDSALKGNDPAKKSEAKRASDKLNALRAKIPEFKDEAAAIDAQCGELRKMLVEEIVKLK